MTSHSQERVSTPNPNQQAHCCRSNDAVVASQQGTRVAPIPQQQHPYPSCPPSQSMTVRVTTSHFQDGELLSRASPPPTPPTSPLLSMEWRRRCKTTRNQSVRPAPIPHPTLMVVMLVKDVKYLSTRLPLAPFACSLHYWTSQQQ